MTRFKTSAFTSQDYQILERKLCYQGVFAMAQYRLKHKLFNGEWSEAFNREVMERPSAAAVLPYDPHRDEVVLIEQFRPGPLASGTHPWVLEVVAGIFDHDEAPEEIVRREAMEEAGCTIKQLQRLFHYHVSPGASNENMTLFIGETDSSAIAGMYGLRDENEDIRAFALPAADAFALVAAGKIQTGPALISLLWLQINKEQLLRLWHLK